MDLVTVFVGISVQYIKKVAVVSQSARLNAAPGSKSGLRAPSNESRDSIVAGSVVWCSDGGGSGGEGEGEGEVMCRLSLMQWL